MSRYQSYPPAAKAIPFGEAIGKFPTFLTPLAALAVAIAGWGLGSDTSFNSFAVGEGLFRHWQVWLASAFAAQSIAVQLTRVKQK